MSQTGFINIFLRALPNPLLGRYPRVQWFWPVGSYLTYASRIYHSVQGGMLRPKRLHPECTGCRSKSRSLTRAAVQEDTCSAYQGTILLEAGWDQDTKWNVKKNPPKNAGSSRVYEVSVLYISHLMYIYLYRSIILNPSKHRNPV